MFVVPTCAVAVLEIHLCGDAYRGIVMLRRNRLNHPAHVRCTLGAGLGLHEYGILGTGRGRRRWKAIDIEARWLVNGGHGASLRHHGVRRPEGGKR
jgi:hypothetical protein